MNIHVFYSFGRFDDPLYSEVLLSLALTVRCGNKTLPFAAFINLDDLRTGFHRPTKQYLDPKLVVLQDIPFSNILRHFEADRQKILKGTSTLAEWVAAVRWFSATDPRDMVYGLLGLANPDDRAVIVPDYSKSVAKV